MSLSLLLTLPLVALLPREVQDAPDWKREVAALLEGGDVPRAIQLLEQRLAASPGDADVHRALARALERLVDEGGSGLALSDARDEWDRALALAPLELETLRAAIGVRMRLGEFESAAALGAQALGSAWLSQGQLPESLLALVCRARLGAFQAREQAGADERAADLAATWSSLEHARALAPASAELTRMAAAFLESEGLPDRAGELLIQALEHAPTATELHRALVDLYQRAGIEERLPALYGGWSASGTNATLAWYTGYVARLAGDLAQRERRFRDALEAYRRSGEWLRVAATLEPSYRATADTLRFQGEVSSAWCELESEALDDASRRLLALLAAEPARRDEPDGLGRSLMHALSALGEKRVEHNDYRHASAEARAVVLVVTEDGGWWNNLGFLLREFATQMQSGAFPEVPEHEQRAREIYRESWQAYLRAVELRPEDVRVINDTALIQVYHLRDNLARAEELLQRAIELGETQLFALGANPDEKERFPIAQALGDACLNLGYLCYHVYRQPERSREFFARSIATDSGDRSYLEEYLAAIDGKRDPLPEQDRGSFVQPPAGSVPERGSIEWEASLADARARARTEQRALIVYNRGDALGLAIPFLDAFVTSPEFARRTRGAVLLVCDRVRRTFVDRRHDGRRVACPLWAPLTCSEHQQAEEEFSLWYRELFGEVPGESEEGLFVLSPGDERPRPLADLEELARLATPEDGEPALAAAPFEAVEASLGGDGGGSEARALVATRSQAARGALERILWEGFSSSPARGHLLRALAEDGQPSSRELLAVCVRQSANPELALTALEVWPAGLDPAPLEHALRWSPSAAVRAAAEAVLARERPEDRSLRARRSLTPR